MLLRDKFTATRGLRVLGSRGVVVAQTADGMYVPFAWPPAQKNTQKRKLFVPILWTSGTQKHNFLETVSIEKETKQDNAHSARHYSFTSYGNPNIRNPVIYIVSPPNIITPI